MTRVSADGSTSYDVGGGVSASTFSSQSSQDFGRNMEQSSTQGAGIVEQKRQAASDAWSTSNSSSTRSFDTAQRVASSNTEEGRGLNNSLARVHDVQSQMANTLETGFGFTKAQADDSSRNAMQTGTFNADAAISSMVGPKGIKELSASGKGSISDQWISQQARNSADSARTERSSKDGLRYLEQESNGSSAREARESFYRQTSSSSDSQSRGSSQEVTQDSRHAQSASEEASRAEDTFQRYQNSFAERRNNNFSISRNDTQDYVRFVQEQMLDPAN
ncbi:hypothetical protein OY671_008346, partial [Metschnikowia pulcherrima]